MVGEKSANTFRDQRLINVSIDETWHISQDIMTLFSQRAADNTRYFYPNCNLLLNLTIIFCA